MEAGFSWIVMLLLATSAGNPNDALDLMDTKAYWKAENLTVETLVEQLDGPRDGEGAQAASVRRLMAIRALGELKDKAALDKLKPFLDDKSPFVAEYAKAAMLSIEGKPCVRAEAAKEKLESDVAALPSGCTLLAQMQAMPGAPVSWDRLGDVLKMMADAPDGADQATDAMRAELAKAFRQFLGRTGNFRLGGLTLAVVGEARKDKGFLVLVARGIYDVDAVRAQLKEAARFGVDEVEGVDVFTADKDVRIACPSADRLIVMAGDRGEKVDDAMKQTLAALKGGKGGLQTDADMKALAGSVDRTKRLWVAAKVTGMMREAEVVAPFDTMTLVAGDKEGATTLTLVGRGQDREKVHAAVATFEDGRKKAVEEMKAKGDQTPEPLRPVFAIYRDFIESVKVAEDGTQATVTATLKGASLPGMFVMGLVPVRHSAGRVESAPPPMPDSAPKQ